MVTLRINGPPLPPEPVQAANAQAAPVFLCRAAKRSPLRAKAPSRPLAARLTMANALSAPLSNHGLPARWQQTAKPATVLRFLARVRPWERAQRCNLARLLQQALLCPLHWRLSRRSRWLHCPRLLPLDRLTKTHRQPSLLLHRSFPQNPKLQNPKLQNPKLQNPKLQWNCRPSHLSRQQSRRPNLQDFVLQGPFAKHAFEARRGQPLRHRWGPTASPLASRPTAQNTWYMQPDTYREQMDGYRRPSRVA